MWLPWLLGCSKSIHNSKRPERRPKRRQTRLAVESLEDRCVLSFIAPVPFAFDGAGVVADFNYDGVVEARAGSDAGDFNRDGNLDIVSLTGVRLGNGNGSFQAPKPFALPKVRQTSGRFQSQTPIQVAAGDFNRDGKLDLAVAGLVPAGNIGVPKTYVNILVGSGTVTFAAASTVQVGAGLSDLKLADFNADGKLDVLTAGGAYFNRNVYFQLGNGDGTLKPPTVVTTSAGGLRVAVGDLNGDGKLDFVTPGTSYLGNGDGTFRLAARHLSGIDVRSIRLADLNRDGQLDIVTADYGRMDPATGNYVDTAVRVLLGNGDGTFQTFRTFASDSGTSSLVCGDFDQDGWIDLVMHSSSSVKLWVNDRIW